MGGSRAATSFERRIGSLVRQAGPITRNAPNLARFAWARATGRKFPLMVTLSLTDKCNFRCHYCDLPHMNRKEMTTADWHRAIDELADAGMMRASIMGGEPLLSKDVGELIDHLKARGVNVAMNTNGWYFAQRIDVVAKLDLVCVTFDGPKAHNDAQRHQGAHDRVLEAIDLAKSRGVKVITMTVVTTANLDVIDYVLQVARDKDIRAFFQIEHPKDGDTNKTIAPQIDDDRSIAAIALHLLRRKEEGWPVGPSKTYLKQLAGHDNQGARRLYSCEDCFASRYFLSVTPTGYVVPCPLTYHDGQLNGREVGFAKAFEALGQPKDPGCSCNPTTELNYLLHFRPEAILNAFELA
jgi:MoaA/NifB/PqqE/SkfB family radical SAM enzyme